MNGYLFNIDTESTQDDFMQRISVEKLFDTRLYDFFEVDVNGKSRHAQTRGIVCRKLLEEKQMTLYELNQLSPGDLKALGLGEKSIAYLSAMLEKIGLGSKEDTVKTPWRNVHAFYNGYKHIVDVDAREYTVPTLIDYRNEKLNSWAADLSENKRELLNKPLGEVISDLPKEIADRFADDDVQLIGDVVLDGIPKRLSEHHKSFLEDKFEDLGLETNLLQFFEDQYTWLYYKKKKTTTAAHEHRIKTYFGLKLVK